ncbi:endonuclease/exonuclease/phosphatase family protein [Streptomyces daliensis]|uniref:Endonuclease/exonuclease/phosphatase family protein n=2 Tax=Streptomyces TaxID=1883 RepID=A0A8T4IKL5_9ACTN|nr:endonuclease/exonuclease/phosphatase family protein [Streptomyces daliensis]
MPGTTSVTPSEGPLSSRLARTCALTLAALCSTLFVLPSSASSAAASGAGEGTRVHDIQGPTRVSPLKGERVTDVPGVVTAIRGFGSARGFWLQDPSPDDDPSTSEGIFVYTGGTTPDVSVGDALRVTGDVSEFYPGGAGSGGQSLTQLSKATWTVESHGNRLPRAEHLDADRVPGRYAPRAKNDDGNIEPLTLRPRSYALDLYESLEGMRTSVRNAPVTGPTTQYNELWVTADPHENRTPRGGTLYGSYTQQNGARMKVSSLIPFSERPFPEANVGDALKGTTAGPLDYDQFGGYAVRATTLGELKDRGLAREKTRPQREDELSVATYNVENLSPKTDPAKFTRLAEALVTNLASPDIVTVEEVQDNTGPADDGTVAADATLEKLTAAIKDAGGPAYEWRQINPADNADGGQPGGNIRVAFLYNPQRVSFTDRPGGDATTPVQAVERDGAPALSASPGRIAPQDAAWEASRKPLAGEFRFRGRPVFVIANHFSSKGGGDLEGDQPLEGRIQPPNRYSEPQRIEQGKLVNSFVKDLRAIDPKAVVVAAGDFNDFNFSPTLDALRAGRALTSPMNRLPANERYGYVFNGNSQSLDHVLTSPGAGRVDYDVVHINAEFHDQSSDHDPSVVRLPLS